ncbi:54S ribosomal protein L37 mitochondrial [Spathaspora sp. JA1]|nr:54S ribosomal protein L37 mitochondrial [Spathaspora sp. JA1]
MFRNITRITSRQFRTGAVLRNSAATGTTTVKSSCAAGTVLNLKVRNKGDEPVALEDSEYPEWLWSMLDSKANRDLLKSSDFMRWRRMNLRKDNIKTIKNNNFLSTM